MTFENVKTTHSSSSSSPPLEKIKGGKHAQQIFVQKFLKNECRRKRDGKRKKWAAWPAATPPLPSSSSSSSWTLQSHYHRYRTTTTPTEKIKKSLKIRQLSWTPFLCVCCFPWAHGEGQSKSSELFVKILLLFGPVFLKKKAATMNALYSPVHT